MKSEICTPQTDWGSWSSIKFYWPIKKFPGAKIGDHKLSNKVTELVHRKQKRDHNSVAKAQRTVNFNLRHLSKLQRAQKHTSLSSISVLFIFYYILKLQSININPSWFAIRKSCIKYLQRRKYQNICHIQKAVFENTKLTACYKYVPCGGINSNMIKYYQIQRHYTGFNHGSALLPISHTSLLSSRQSTPILFYLWWIIFEAD